MALRKEVEDKVCERCGERFNRTVWPNGVTREGINHFLRRRFCTGCRRSQYSTTTKDLTGQRIGYLRVIRRATWRVGTQRGTVFWECLCDCGKTTIKRYGGLVRAKIVSCGCKAKNRASELIGQTFGRLTVIGRAENTRQATRCWVCRCECGREHLVRTAALRRGAVRSCGCLQRKLMGDRQRTHGLSHLPEYQTYSSMMDRCYNPDNSSFENYGGRGVRVCERWLDSVANFIADMGQKPSKHHSLDRIDCNGHYEPSNCRWALPEDQARNRRNVRPFTYAGRTMILTDWCSEAGWFANPKAIYTRALKRLDDLGWSFEDAVFTPPRDNFQSLLNKGETTP